MSDKFLPDISVGDFAANILKGMAKDPNGLKPALKESTVQSSNAPDISKINVSEDFVQKVVQGKNPLKKSAVIVEQTTEVRMANLIDRLSSLLVEARQIMEEVTGVGNIGTNTLGRSIMSKKNRDPFKRRRKGNRYGRSI